MVLSFSDLMNKLKKKTFEPVYFLHGEESYFIDVVSGIPLLSIIEIGFFIYTLNGNTTISKGMIKLLFRAILEQRYA